MRLQSSLKSHSLPHYITGFFFLSSTFFFFFWTVGSVPESLQVREIADIYLLKLRILGFSWSDMSGLRCNTPLKEFMSFQEEIIC